MSDSQAENARLIRIGVKVRVVKIVEVLMRNGSAGDKDADDVSVRKSPGQFV
jgi:hypothetical protein